MSTSLTQFRQQVVSNPEIVRVRLVAEGNRSATVDLSPDCDRKKVLCEFCMRTFAEFSRQAERTSHPVLTGNSQMIVYVPTGRPCFNVHAIAEDDHQCVKIAEQWTIAVVPPPTSRP